MVAVGGFRAGFEGLAQVVAPSFRTHELAAAEGVVLVHQEAHRFDDHLDSVPSETLGDPLRCAAGEQR